MFAIAVGGSPPLGEACLMAARARRQRSRHAGRWPSRATSRSRGPLGERSLFGSCARRGPTMELPFAEVAARRRLSLARRMLTPEPRWRHCRACAAATSSNGARPISAPLCHRRHARSQPSVGGRALPAIAENIARRCADQARAARWSRGARRRTPPTKPCASAFRVTTHLCMEIKENKQCKSMTAKKLLVQPPRLRNPPFAEA